MDDTSLASFKTLDNDENPGFDVEPRLRCITCEKLLSEGVFLTVNNNFYHGNCFRCEKCGKTLAVRDAVAFTNSNQPICKDCVEVCKACKSPILDMAIITGMDAYHSTCFFCSSCNTKITEAIFARRNNQLFCMKCLQITDAVTSPTTRGHSRSVSGASFFKASSNNCNRYSYLSSPVPKLGAELSLSAAAATFAQRVVSPIDMNQNTIAERLAVPDVSSISASTPVDPSLPLGSNSAKPALRLYTSNPIIASSTENSNVIPEVVQLSDGSDLSNNESSGTAFSAPNSVATKHASLHVPLVAAQVNDKENEAAVHTPITSPVSVTYSPKDHITLAQEKQGSIAAAAAQLPAGSATANSSARRPVQIPRSVPTTPEHLRDSLNRLRSVSNTSTGSNVLGDNNFRRVSSEVSQPHIPKSVNAVEDPVQCTSPVNEPRTSTSTVHSITPTGARKVAGEAIASKPRVPSNSPFNSAAYRAKSLSFIQDPAERELYAGQGDVSNSSLVRLSGIFSSNVFDETENDARDLVSKMAGLHVQRAVLLMEISSLLRMKDRSPALTPNRFKQEFIADVNRGLDSLRKSFQPELASLLLKRDALSATVEKLQNAYSASMEETAYLNVKNAELLGINNQLEREIASKKEEYSKKRQSTFGFSRHFRNRHSTTDKDEVTSSSSRESHSRLQQVASSLGFRPREKYNPSESPQQQPANLEHKGSFSRRFLWRRDSKHPSSKAKNRASSVMSFSDLKITEEDEIPSFGMCKLCGNYSKNLPRHYQDCLSQAMDGQYQAQRQVQVNPLVETSSFDPQRYTLTRVPHLITACIGFVEKYGLDYEGLYRKSGATSQMKRIVSLLENGNTELGPNEDISAVTSVLKQYLRNLPNPIITFDQYYPLIEASGIRKPAEKLIGIKRVISNLPSIHGQVLRLIMFHLANVVKMSHLNLMNSKNLAVVFSPTLIRDPDNSRDVLDMAMKNLCLHFMIDHVEELF
ncbi:rho-type GTPase activating protein Rga4 [Schizosaccharomyces japonicus yFS275]|uniref:Rho-type GTPase activating protein Rga4 n=1 Tax=Schizosaccharomyces japonicus (strain yFS275 / FY16936) TaxID=402676 RepID=B6K719_SCHJY|nr:rho-type GTPase activating protein Rga4 [Schizosaccharomyces japonicus yFS275]EEB09323.1 rho-type GTPase activating protein Rga4 [Schizosaccharomyces japonicus yFS275]